MVDAEGIQEGLVTGEGVVEEGEGEEGGGGEEEQQ